MIDKSQILICIQSEEVIISYDGKKLIQPKSKFLDMTKEQIKEWYINRYLEGNIE
jgi:hypothetical protein